MTDGFGRNIDYLRISVTDKCNLRCRYCMPKEGVLKMSHDELLTLEEIVRVCRIMADIGVKKIRLTGGEPLVRKNITKLIADIRGIQKIEEIAITTNGVLYAPMAKELAAAGLDSVNLSLDTTDPEAFENITGSSAYEQVERAFTAALELGMKLKINCVPCKELNDKDIISVAKIAQKNPVDVRFIELMPIGCGKIYTGIGSDEILGRLEAVFGSANAVEARRGSGPARYVEFAGFAGKIGFISPLSHKFCRDCNRVRLTAEGLLKLCLHYDSGIMLRELLRDEKCGDEDIKEAIAGAVAGKPKSHNFEQENGDSRKMYQIGG